MTHVIEEFGMPPGLTPEKLKEWSKRKEVTLNYGYVSWHKWSGYKDWFEITFVDAVLTSALAWRDTDTAQQLAFELNADRQGLPIVVVGPQFEKVFSCRPGWSRSDLPPGTRFRQTVR